MASNRKEEDGMAAEDNSDVDTQLQSSDFRDAVARFREENKLDRLCHQQTEGWILEWTSSAGTTTNETEEATKHKLEGSLKWTGAHATVVLETSCEWTAEGDDNNQQDNATTKKTLSFRCRASGSFLKTPNPSAAEEDEEEEDEKKKKSNAKVQKKVHAKVVQRLKQDDYLQKLMDGNDKLDVCDASIVVRTAIDQDNDDDNAGSLLEERVHWNETAVEAIRRAVFSHAESTLDVLHLIVSFPFLPTTAPITIADDDKDSSAATARRTTPLADRAKLRLLEDASHAACEQEEEEEAVRELHISKRAKS